MIVNSLEGHRIFTTGLNTLEKELSDYEIQKKETCDKISKQEAKNSAGNYNDLLSLLKDMLLLIETQIKIVNAAINILNYILYTDINFFIWIYKPGLRALIPCNEVIRKKDYKSTDFDVKTPSRLNLFYIYNDENDVKSFGNLGIRNTLILFKMTDYDFVNDIYPETNDIYPETLGGAITGFCLVMCEYNFPFKDQISQIKNKFPANYVLVTENDYLYCMPTHNSQFLWFCLTTFPILFFKCEILECFKHFPPFAFLIKLGLTCDTCYATEPINYGLKTIYYCRSLVQCKDHPTAEFVELKSIYTTPFPEINYQPDDFKLLGTDPDFEFTVDKNEQKEDGTIPLPLNVNAAKKLILNADNAFVVDKNDYLKMRRSDYFSSIPAFKPSRDPLRSYFLAKWSPFDTGSEILQQQQFFYSNPSQIEVILKELSPTILYYFQLVRIPGSRFNEYHF
jgi:hypothetical protein